MQQVVYSSVSVTFPPRLATMRPVMVCSSARVALVAPGGCCCFCATWVDTRCGTNRGLARWWERQQQ
ncbi:hypothetical protein BD289DRAFT_441871 [Coniella lustricola]|uniref:Uncharacterized protein n=1 Tax=Coniella lustricola TaxID=2025994 RepID=A0A2T2ZYZ7_9PEZI|nr:hypothetical protein BD289DRAFT_441871 [Coniella lustricola]